MTDEPVTPRQDSLVGAALDLTPPPEEESLLEVLGPGLITGASDDDPSGIGTYSVAGAVHGYQLLWLAPFTYPLMTSVQLTCAQVGMVSGRGLAGVLRTWYPKAVLYPALVGLLIANTLNAGADIGAIAEAFGLVVPINAAWLYIPVALVILALQVFGSYRLIARIFKWTALSLLAYIGAGLLAGPDWSQVARHTLVPTIRFDRMFIMTVVAVLGTTISPYLFFWQSNQVVEEEIQEGRTTVASRRGATDAELHNAALDTNAGMFLSNLVMFFIMLATAATLHATGNTQIESAADAARALEPLAGTWAKYLLALGMIGSGFLAVPILTGSAAYAFSEGFGWRAGLDEKPRKARKFYAIIVLSTLLGLTINVAGIGAITALYWSAVVNGLLAPPLLVLIMLISRNPKVMGRRTVSGWQFRLGWTAAVLMTIAALVLVGFWIAERVA